MSWLLKCMRAIFPNCFLKHETEFVRNVRHVGVGNESGTWRSGLYRCKHCSFYEFGPVIIEKKGHLRAVS